MHSSCAADALVMRLERAWSDAAAARTEAGGTHRLPEPSMIASPSPARPSLRPLCAALLPCGLLCGASGAVADTVTLTELPAPAGYAVAGVANIAADGTVIGVVYPDGLVVRWQPGATPEVLGGGLTFTLDNITPLISKDGSAIATTGYFDDGGEAPVAAPELWTGGTDWAR